MWQTEQVQYALLPSSVQVESFASVLVRLWPVASMIQLSFSISFSPFSSEKYLWQTEQVQYSLLPSSVQVGSFASVLVRLWPVASMSQLSFSISVLPFSSEKNLPQTEQVQYALLPSSVQVAALASVLVRLWPVASMSQLSFSISVVPFSSEKNLLQMEQVQYSLLPSSVQVAAFASVLVRLWPLASMTQLSFPISVVPFSSEKNLPQTEQVQYSLLPSSVQVGSFASVLVRL